MPIVSNQIGVGQVTDEKLASTFLKADGTVKATGNADMNSQRIVNLAAPVNSSDAARKADIDAITGTNFETDSTKLSTINASDTASLGTRSFDTRSDHQHAVATGSPIAIGAILNEGENTSLARSDHGHIIDSTALSATGGLEIVSNTVAINLDGTTLSVGASGLKIAANGITTGEFNSTVYGVAADMSQINIGDVALAGTLAMVSRVDHTHAVGIAGANPSASIGLTAINGTATTFMRSDAAPALDQAIAPTWTGLHSWSRAGALISAKNTTDAASVQLGILEGDRATPGANDEAYITLRLSNSIGTQLEFGRITCAGTNISDGLEEGKLDFSVYTSGVGIQKELSLSSTALFPSTDDGLALGVSSTNMWSDLYLANGSVINFNGGDVTITHSSNTLAIGGATLIDIAAGRLECNDQIRFDTGVAVTAGEYSIGRDADATNQLHLNIPTDASIEISINDVAHYIIDTNNIRPSGTRSLGQNGSTWSSVRTPLVQPSDNANTLTLSIPGISGNGAKTVGLGFASNYLLVQTGDASVAVSTNPRVVVDGARFQGDQGAAVASANSITLGTGNLFEITGTTQVNAITVAQWQYGSVITLLFEQSVTVAHNTAGAAGTAVILLSGAANFSATAGDTLTLCYSTNEGSTDAWRELARTVI